MSHVRPTSSHQLVAASLAFHRARKKFIKNSTQRIQPGHKEPKSIQASNGLTRPRTIGYWYRGNCKSEGTVDAELDGSIGDYVDTLPNAMACDGRGLENSLYSGVFRNAQDRFNDQLLPKENENCSCHHDRCKRKINVECQISGDSIDLPSNDGCAQAPANKDDHQSYNFPQKLYEWECRTCQEPLMKTQRLFPRQVSELKRDVEVTDTRHQFIRCNHLCRSSEIHSHQEQYKFENHISGEILSTSKDFHQKKNQKHNFLNGNRMFCDSCNDSHSSKHILANEIDLQDRKDGTEDDESKDIQIIKHKDSMIILTEKFRCKNIGYNLIENVDCESYQIVKSSSCEKVLDQKVLDQTTKECRISKEVVDTETCCTRKNSSTRELRFNKLADRLKPKCLKSRLTRTEILCTNE